MKKNLRLFTILLGLIVVSISIGLVGTKSKKQSFNSDMFKVTDATSIKTLSIGVGDIKNTLSNVGNQWKLNDRYIADADLIKILRTILSQVTVKRPVAKLNNEDILDDLKENGKRVVIKLEDGSNIDFISGGNASKTTSYFADLKNNIAYVVEIPGYKNYISGIFELTENQWRDRLLFSSSWRTIKALNINYDAQPDLRISFEDRFLKVEGVNEMDTTALLNYLAQFEFFQVNDYLNPGNHAKYDSLMSTKPHAIIDIRDIDDTKNKNLKVFAKIKGERFYLVTDEANEMMVVDENRMEAMLIQKEKFKSE